MTELLHLSALLPAAFGVCCTVGGRRRGRVLLGFEGVAALVMLVAMADVALGLGLVAPILWVGGLVVVALVGATPLAGGSSTPMAGGSASDRSRGSRAGSSASVAEPVIEPRRNLRQASGEVAGLPQASGRGATHRSLHTNLGLIVMAGLVALMSADHAAPVSSHQGGSGMLPVLVLNGSAAYIGYSVRRATALLRMPHRDLVGCLEAACMAASVALMAGALAV